MSQYGLTALKRGLILSGAILFPASTALTADLTPPLPTGWTGFYAGG
jgi:hypothetical protein